MMRDSEIRAARGERLSPMPAGWRRGAAASLVLAVLVTACMGAKDGDLKEVQRVRSGAIDVVLLSSHDGLRHGTDSFIVEFRGGDGQLTDVGEVRANATMPMPGAPMFASIDVKRTAVAGRYTAQGQFDMAGSWRMTLQWQGPGGSGSVTFSGTVQ